MWRVIIGGGMMVGLHPFTNHNLSHEGVVAQELLPDIWVNWVIKLEVKVKIYVDSTRTKLFKSDCLI